MNTGTNFYFIFDTPIQNLEPVGYHIMNVLQMLRLQSGCVGWLGQPEHEAGHDLLRIVVVLYKS
jgi:hypothetical protein